MLILRLNVDVVKDAVQSIDLLRCPRRSMLSQDLISVVPDELLLRLRLLLLLLHARWRSSRQVVCT